ncbi:zincin-like metallopeptidase domain-containing protein [Capnocytophaga sputigena]|uniref:zincin-like metallopeptidase domain-containing protein n=1 Tax=Capnocytophaga sputigena TaxID=1019 RepID=UPI000F840CFC|nr:zincin-like metallopeptidase domain-containing protein [Capnocytophaga sputigena]
MEKIMKEFIALHNRTVSRDEIQTVIALAKEQNNTEVIYRLSKILNDHPDSNRFNINIINYPQETTQQVALAGTRHSGDYREALDENGCLKKGWKFSNGQVVKVTPKKAPDTPSTEGNKENKLYKFIVVIGHNFLGIYSYNDPKIEGFWQTNTTDNGIQIFTAISKRKKITKKKGISLILQKYTEGKDFIFVEYDYASLNKYLLLLEKPILGLSAANDEIAFLSAAGIDYFPEAPDDETQGLGKPVPAADIYKMVTDKIIGMLKSASPTDYHRAWKDDAFFIPLNYDSKKPYRGVNRLLLQERIGFAGAFRNPYFLTFKQIKKHKGTLKKGAKGYEVIYYSIRYVVPADKNTGRKAYSSTNTQKVIDYLAKNKLSEDIVTRIPMIRYYNVYNGASIEGIDFQLDKLQIGRAVPDTASENQAAALIVENYPNPPAIKHEGNRAYYSPSGDYVKMPKKEQFDSINDYYRILFHELTHSTGHDKRLDRGIHLMLEKEDYAKEELVAEFGAVFLSAWAGIMWYTNKNHAVYLKNWNSAIKEAENDNKFLMRAASLAQQATDYILALDKDGNPAFLKKLQPKKAPKNTPQTPTDKSSPSDSSSNKNVFFEEYRQLKAKYPEHLIIVSMEDHQNYCMYGKDAVIAADILKLQLLKLKRNDEFSISVGFKYKNLREYLEKLVKAGYKVALKESLYEPQSSPKKNTPKTPTDKSAPSDSSSNKNTKKKAPRTTQYKGVKTIPLTDLYTDEKRFQNRKKLNEEIVENIVNNFKPTDLDPLVVWYDEKQGKTFVLAGHHRYEALKRLGHKTVPVKYANDDYPTEADAIRYAKEISNANRTLEEPYERAAIYRKYRDEGYSEKEINEKANIEGKNRSYILNLSCLNPKGSTMSTLVQFSQTQSKADKNEIERIADWIGQARRNAPELTNAHEQEMFDFLMNKEASKRTSTKAKFLEYVRACWNPFAPSEPLNLARMKYQLEGEKQYDEEVENLKTQISTYQGYIDNLKDRFINPSNKDFVNPTAPDYMAVKKIADDKIAEYNTKIQYYQSQLMKVYQNKQTYIKPTGQTALFGKYPEIDTARFKKMKVSELRTFTMKYYNLYLKGDSATIEKYVKEVVFINTAGRKIAYGEAMYSAKAAVIAHLKTLIKNSTYNNWGDRKASDGKDVLGYLNFKSKITIDNKKRHVRISLVVYKDRRTELKNVEVGKNKKVPHFAQDPVGTLQDGRNETLSTESVAKTVPNSTLSAPEVFVEHSPDPATQSAPSITPRNNSIANKMATLQNRTFETFIIAEPQMQAFLGDVERKNTGSTAITITGGAGSGKTRFAFQFINALAQNYKVGHASLEEQPDSKLYFDKVQQYLDQTAQANVEAPEIENMQDLQALIERNDVIVIDSFTKIREWNRNFLLDRDLRKKYNGKLFLIIFQQTVAGNMRGGTTSEFDGDIILYTQVFPNYRENYIYPSKNRYNSTPSEQLRYSVYHQQLLPSESTPPDSSPVTSNTYEVIY